MSYINERITSVVNAVGLSKTAFAQRINVSQPFISKLCSGDGTPSDRTISDICREFGVDEIWLRTGVGEMFHARSRSEDIAAFMGDVLRAGDSDFRSRLVSALSRLSVEEWALLEQMAEKLAADEKKTEP